MHILYRRYGEMASRRPHKPKIGRVGYDTCYLAECLVAGGTVTSLKDPNCPYNTQAPFIILKIGKTCSGWSSYIKLKICRNNCSIKSTSLF